MEISYSRHPRFEKQLKKLLKKYRTLEDDLAIAQKAAIELYHMLGKDNDSVELVPGFDYEEIKIYKVKKFACKSLFGKGVKSGIRVTYGFFPVQEHVEYLEIYYKEKGDSDMDYGFAKIYVSEVRNKP